MFNCDRQSSISTATQDYIKGRISSESDVTTKIAWAKLYGILRWSTGGEPLAGTKLEEYLYALVEAEHKQHQVCEKPTSTDETGIVATELYNSGGHTSLLLNFLEALDVNVSLILTGVSTNGYSPNSKRIPGVERFEGTPSTARIHAMAKKFGEFRRIFLFIHPIDIEASLAAALARQYYGTEVFFVNHADHIFSFGYFCANRVLEISAYGWALRNRRESTVASSYIGIPIKRELHATKPIRRDARGYVEAFSSGSSLKYKPLFDISFPFFIRRLLTENKQLRVTVLGPVLATDTWWWTAKLRHPWRLRIKKRVPHSKYIQLLDACTIYLDSFPITGGTALPEAYAAGLNVFGLARGVTGYSTLEELKAMTVHELHNEILTFVASGERERVKLDGVRDRFIRNHSFESFKQRVVDSVYEGKLISPPFNLAKIELFQQDIAIGGKEAMLWAQHYCSGAASDFIQFILLRLFRFRIKDSIAIAIGALKRCL